MGDSSNNKKETINSLQSQLNTLKQKYSTLIKLNQKSLEKIIRQRKEINNLLHHVKLQLYGETVDALALGAST